jgi:hypothetical protein
MIKRLFLQFSVLGITLSAIGQEKISDVAVSNNFQPGDYAKGYYNQYENNFRVTLQNGNAFTRFLYDSNFNLLDSFSFDTRAITFNYTDLKKLKFLAAITIESGSYEVYAEEKRIVLVKPDFKSKTDKTVYEHSIAQTEKDETLLAVFPGRDVIRILSASFKTDKLLLYTWSPGGAVAKDSFDLPESNITDEKLKKEIPKTARIKFSRSLTNLVIQPLDQTSIMARDDSYLYYSDSLVYIHTGTPYNLGVYVIELNLHTRQFKGTNYLVNTLKDNASDKAYLHKTATGLIYDTLLVVKNGSERVYEFYFYDVRTGVLLKKYSSPPSELKGLIHSDMKQKGSWASANEEKDFDNYKKFLRKGGRGVILAAAVSRDSLTLTNLYLIPTTGIAGSLLDVFVPLPLELAGMPFYASAFIPPVGKSRDKIIYAHSRFSIRDLSPSASTNVTTVFDDLLDDRNAKEISSHSSFLINKKDSYYLGYYSKDSNKIEIYRYHGIQ